MKESDVKREIIGFFTKRHGTFVSGEEISEKLGFSRAYLWKHIVALRSEGYKIEASPRLGYSLTSVPDKLHGYLFSSGLKTKTFGKKDIFHFESIPSTNDTAYALAEKGALEGTLVIAESQTSGKGRMGRKWASPGKGGIYFSIILRPDIGIGQIASVTLVAGLAVAKAIRDVSGLIAALKWPNDVVYNGSPNGEAGKKLCGILTEIKAEPDRVDFIIVGIGINVNTPLSALPDVGTSLKTEIGKEISRAEVLKSVLKYFEEDYKKFCAEGFSALREEYKNFSSMLGKKVKVNGPNGTISGIAKDIDESGALVIETTSGAIKKIFSGDVTL